MQQSSKKKSCTYVVILMRYIVLLRGINVSSQKRVKMADLKEIFESLGFEDVRTYVQSGNVIFDYELTDTEKLASYIENKINQILGLSINIIIRTKEELVEIVNNNPFVAEANIATDKLHVIFLLDVPDPKTTSHLDIKKDKNEEFKIVCREVYLYCPNGYGRTKLNNATFERKLHTIATTRNWKTTNKLLELSKLEQT